MMSSSGAACKDAAGALQTVPFCKESNSALAISHWHDNQRSSQKSESGMGEEEKRKGTVYFEMPRSMNIKINTFIKRFQYKDAKHSHAESQLLVCARLADCCTGTREHLFAQSQKCFQAQNFISPYPLPPRSPPPEPEEAWRRGEMAIAIAMCIRGKIAEVQ